MLDARTQSKEIDGIGCSLFPFHLSLKATKIEDVQDESITAFKFFFRGSSDSRGYGQGISSIM
jgi:hypothetical protein